MKNYLASNTLLAIVKCKIARRFAFYIVSFGLLVALFISAIVLYNKYHNDLVKLNEELVHIERSIKSSLSQSLWQMNFNALDVLTNDLFMNKDIVYVALYDEEGSILIEKGEKQQKNVIAKTIRLYHQSNGKELYLGKLDYIATTKNIYEKNKQAVFSAIIPIIIFFILLSIAIILFFWHFIVKHLLAIKDYTDKLNLESYDSGEIDDLVLDRSSDIRKKEDALSILVSAINNMHHEIVEKYTAIEFQSLHDALTGLPNRRMINQLMIDAIAHCHEANGYGVLFYIDLDQFKLLNDSMGHTVGDRILLEISSRLVSVCKPGYQPSRIAGDEFLILQSKVVTGREEAKASAMDFAKKILSGISERIKIDNSCFKIKACIGITIFGTEVNAEVVMKQADNALYHAKETGRGQIMFFAPNMQKMTDRRLQLEQLIDDAIEKDLFFVNYQPKYDHQHKISSAEALVRLRGKNGSIVSPGEFIPIAEESGLVIKIGDRIIEKVFEFIKTNQLDIEQSGIKSIAINVSPTQYSARGFTDKVVAYAKKFEIDPDFIILEITEEVVAGSIDAVLDVMMQLKKHGFNFSIDDFGTGYSSLRYLRNFPLNELKIDKSFVDDILEDDKAVAVVKTIIDMAHNLKLDVVAEGVENIEQFNILHQYGCELYQGFLFSRPLMENDFLAELKVHNKLQKYG